MDTFPEYSDDLTEYGTSDQLMKFDNSDLMVPSLNASKDISLNIGLLNEDDVEDLRDNAPRDDFRDFNMGNFSLGDFIDDKQLENYLATAGMEDQSTGNTYQSLQPVDPSTSFYSPPPAVGMMNGSDPTLPSVMQPEPISISAVPAPAVMPQADAKPRGRKSAHVVKPCSPPSYADSLPGSPAVKQETMIAAPSSSKTPAKRRKAASASSSRSSVSGFESEDSVGTPRPKKPKMHEMPFDPKAKNAVAAKKNREKKKNEEQRLKTENDALRVVLSGKDNEILQANMSNMELQKQLAIERARCQSLQGLARVTKSAGNILQMVVTGIYSGSGEQYSVEFPKWFQQAPANAENYEAAQEFLQVGKTSSFITLHISKEEKKIRVDYNPKEPQISHDIPVPPQ